MKEDIKKNFSNNEWKAIEQVAEETYQDSGLSKDELLLKMATSRINEQKSVAASYKALKKYGWDKELVVNAIEIGMGEDGLKAVEKLATELWIELGVYDVFEEKGVTHPSGKKVLPISLIKFLATQLLERMMVHDGKIPVPLVFLIRDLLDARAYGHNKVRAPYQEKLAVYYFAKNAESKASEIAKMVGVDKTTVTRWLQSPDFMAQVERLKTDGSELAHQSILLEEGLSPFSDWDD